MTVVHFFFQISLTWFIMNNNVISENYTCIWKRCYSTYVSRKPILIPSKHKAYRCARKYAVIAFSSFTYFEVVHVMAFSVFKIYYARLWTAYKPSGSLGMKRLGELFSIPPWMGCQSIAGLPPALNLLVPIYAPGWREAPWEWSVLPKNTTQCPRSGLEFGPLNPESSALTMRPPRLPKINQLCALSKYNYHKSF